MSHNGTCRKCGQQRDKGDHKRCDYFRTGLHYRANSKETTIAEFKSICALISEGEDDDAPVQFDIRIREVFDK